MKRSLTRLARSNASRVISREEIQRKRKYSASRTENPILEWSICGSVIRPLVGRTVSWQWYITCSLPLGIRCDALFQDSGSSSRPYLSLQTITSSVSLRHGCADTAKIKDTAKKITFRRGCFWDDTFVCLTTRAPQRIHLPKSRYIGLFRAVLPKGLKMGFKRRRIASKRFAKSYISPPSTLQAHEKLQHGLFFFLFFADHKCVCYYY